MINLRVSRYLSTFFLGTILTACSAGVAQDRETVIEHVGGDTTIVRTDRDGMHTVEHASGGGATHGFGTTHNEIVDRHTQTGDTVQQVRP